MIDRCPHLFLVRGLTALGALAVMAPVSADHGPPAEVVVTGTRLAVEASELPGTGTILDREEMEARGDGNGIDLLRSLPGLQVVQPAPGSVTQLFIRGAEPNFTVFLVDGIRVNDPNNTRGGSFDLAALNLADMERVEIVRGPQSSIYGSDGLAGVINFITPGGSDALSALVEGEAGGDDFRRGTVQVSGPAGGGGFSLQFTSRDEGDPVPGGRFEADTLTGRLRLKPVEAVTANLYLRFADTEGSTFPEQSGGPELAILRDLETSSARDLSVGADLDWRLNDTVSLQALVSRYDRRDRYDSPGIFPGDQVPANGARNDLERDNAALRLTAESGRLRGTVGLDFLRESGESDGYLEFAPDFRVPNSFSLERDILGVFAEGRFVASEALLLQASVRHDDPEDTSGRTTARLGAVATTHEGRTRWRASWGTGFKLPSFFALGSPIVGEPNLKPEKSRSAELGVSRELGDRTQVGISLFSNDYEDLIDFDPDTFRSVNRDEVRIRGLELAASWALGAAVDLRGHATWTDIDVLDSDRKLLQRPDWRGGAGLRWRPRESWTVDLDWLWVGETLDNAIPTGQLTLDDQHRVDLAVGWQATPRFRLGLAVDNLLDADYEEAIGFPTPGIRPRLTARYRFGD
jgi:vitamin B12 transporter